MPPLLPPPEKTHRELRSFHNQTARLCPSCGAAPCFMARARNRAVSKGAAAIVWVGEAEDASLPTEFGCVALLPRQILIQCRGLSREIGPLTPTSPLRGEGAHRDRGSVGEHFRHKAAP